MRALATLVFMALLLFTVAIRSNAATTLTIGQTFGSKETIHDNHFFYFDSQSLSNFYFNLIYIKKIEVSLEFQSGDTDFYYSSHRMEFSNSKLGYPVWDHQNFLAFVTAGYMRYVREYISDSQGFMTGIDVIYVAGENLYLGLDIQYSLLGASYKRQYPAYIELPMDLMSVKLKVQYTFTDNIGLVASVHWLRFDANGGYIAEDVLMPSLGVIYRF